MNGKVEVVAFGCNKQSTTGNVRISDITKTAHKSKAGIRNKKKSTDYCRNKKTKNGQDKSKNGKVIEEETHVSFENLHLKTPKRLGEPYQNTLKFLETGQLLLFKGRNYKIFVSIWLEFSRTHPVSCVFDIGAGPDLINAVVLGQRWLKNLHQCDTLEIRGALNTRLAVTGTITLHLQLSKTRTRVSFSVVDRFAVPVLFPATFIGKSVKSIPPAKTKIVPYHCLPVPILMVHDASIEAEKNTPDICQFVKQNTALLVMSINGEPKILQLLNE